MEVTLGGNRVGSGQKMKAHLHNYYRSTHNLSEKFASSAQCGILYPAMCKLAMRGDTFDIGINADARTIPTKGPLFGSFKMQVDVYQAPIRLYQGILHNNPLAIGLKMSQVKFPTLRIMTHHQIHDKSTKNAEFSKSCLLKYLGMSGLGLKSQPDEDTYTFGRKINALPVLSYYDIFKTYYANKQEEKGYVITGTRTEEEANVIKKAYYVKEGVENNLTLGNTTEVSITGNGQYDIYVEFNEGSLESITEYEELFSLLISDDEDNVLLDQALTKYDFMTENSFEYGGLKVFIWKQEENKYKIHCIILQMPGDQSKFDMEPYDTTFNYIANKTIQIKDFNLTQVDDMRYALLANSNSLGQAFEIGQSDYETNWTEGSGQDGTGLPYSTLFGVDEVDGTTLNTLPLNGLVLKTYQNDIYNNWLNTEWIEGENGITEMSKVSVGEDGEFSMDALNFAQKLYNMLNRIAVAGNTYEDWQDVVYEEVKRRQIESPIYCGGMSQEVMFDEIVQTAPAEGDPLGTLGGRGRLVQGTRKGGNIHIKCDEACFIIAIVSLTPRIFYTQGNEFYLTDVFSMDDLHKPAMDGIGFQDLIGERLAWWDTLIGSGTTVTKRSRIGKLPAWIEYMTSVDRAYGDFAEEYGKGYMILNRNYERGETWGTIKDATTYVDPSKYNYAFAYSALDAQNFWLEIEFKIKARRLMSARLIPNV